MGYIIKNLTKKTTLSTDTKFATSFLDRALGLLRKSNPKTLIFQTRFGLHTFLLKEPIDVIVLNNENIAVKLQKDLKPNNLIFWNPKYSLCIELPKNSLKNSKTEIGDKISYKNVKRI